MLFRFAENSSSTRDWCSYWEITKDNRPASVDYTNDQDFWYNLPANFDIICTCYNQYLWTGDMTYLQDPILSNFYDLTVTNYVSAWDKDEDGLLEHYPEYGRRGLATYNEAGNQPLVGGDMIAIQIAGYKAYAKILRLKGDEDGYRKFAAMAEHLQHVYTGEWWNEKNMRFYGALLQDRSFYAGYHAEGNFLPLFYGAIRDEKKINYALEDVNKQGAPNTEGKTYLPDIFYRYDKNDAALSRLLELVNPHLERREYPEVSFSVVGSIATGLMGISADGMATVSTMSRLCHGIDWAIISDLPILQHRISVKHVGLHQSQLTNLKGEQLCWKAFFPTNPDYLLHNNRKIETEKEIGENGRERAFVMVVVAEGETHTLSLPIE